MKQGVPWSVKGVGPDAREAAKDLARRSGMTLGQWLNAMIAGQDGTQPGKDRTVVSESPLAAIARRLEAMKQEGQPGGGLREAMAGGVSEAVVARHIRASETRTADLFDRLMRRQEESETHIATLIGGIVDTLAETRRGGVAPIGEAALAQEEPEQEEDEDTGPVGKALGDLAARLNAGGAQDLDSLAENLERRLAAMGRDLDAAAGAAAIDEAQREGSEDRVAALAREIDEIRRGHDEARSFEARLDEAGMAALRADIAGLDRNIGQHIAAAIPSGHLATIDRKLDLLTRQAQDPTVLAAIQREVADIRERIGERNRGPDLSEVMGRLDHFIARFQPIEAALGDLTAKAPRAFERIDRRLDILQSTFESGHASTHASLAGLMTELGARLDAMQRDHAQRDAAPPDNAALAALERQVSQMAEGLDAIKSARPDKSAGDENAPDIGALDMDALAPALREALGATPLQALPDEMRRLFGELRGFQDNDARGTKKTLEALQRTLRDLSDRLTTIEDLTRTRTIGPIPVHVPESGEGPSLFGRDSADDIVWSDDLPRALAGDGATSPRNGEKSPEFTPSVANGRPSQVSALGNEARGFFIAAARRAVRAAAEADGSLRHEVKNTGNPETESFYRRHKRSILLGLAAVTMMMGALQGGRVHVLPGEARNMSSGPSVDAARSPSLSLSADRSEAKSFYEEACGLDQPDASTLDLVKACGLYRQAALRGYVPAFFRLGLAYDRGRGVGHDAVLAGVWYQRAADHGSVKAMHNLAVLYATGAVTDGPDYRQTARWFRQAAERGHAASQYNYALLAAQGLGTPRNLSLAYRFLSLAAGQGDADALVKRNEIGTRLAPGEKTAIDAEMARG